MEKLLTIIIPTYNMELYLDACLGSLVVPDYMDSLEILIVNDGSKDSSPEIAKKYVTRYTKTFVLIDKPNGNYGSCVNRGVQEANGKYVKILDADDSFDTANFQQFLSFLKNTDADLIITPFAITNPKREITKIIKFDFTTGVEMLFADVCATEQFRNNIQMHAVTYKRDIFRQVKYKQTEGISYTDQQWIFIPMLGVKSVVFYDEYVYKYLVGREGQTMDSKVKLKSLSHIAKCSLGMLEMYETNRPYKEDAPIKIYIEVRLIYFIKTVYVNCFSNYNKGGSAILEDFDSQFKVISPKTYELVGSKDITSVAGIPYISIWRKNKRYASFAIGMASALYKSVLKLKQKFSSKNKMDISHAN